MFPHKRQHPLFVNIDFDSFESFSSIYWFSSQTCSRGDRRIFRIQSISMVMQYLWLTFYVFEYTFRKKKKLGASRNATKRKMTCCKRIWEDAGEGVWNCDERKRILKEMKYRKRRFSFCITAYSILVHHLNKIPFMYWIENTLV